VEVCSTTIQGLTRTFGEHETGTLIALIGSSGYLMISVVNGSATNLLQPKIGDEVKLMFG
jgi:S-adenosylmethionine hydrolase